MVYEVDRASFGHCPDCGDEIVLEQLTRDQVNEKAIEVAQRGGTCDRCDEGSTPFDKQVRFQILQWLGPAEFRKNIATVIEPQNASYVVVTLKDGRKAKILRHGESSRKLPEEVDHVFRHSFPDLKQVEKPWKK